MSLPPTTYHAQPRSGFAALLVIVTIGAAALIMAYNASLLGLGELESGFTSQQGSEAFSIADGCLEEALRRLRLSPTLSGTLTPPVAGGGSCSVTITAGGVSCAAPIIVDATGCTASSCVTPGTYSKKIQTRLFITTTNQENSITICKWEEVP